MFVEELTNSTPSKFGYNLSSVFRRDYDNINTNDNNGWNIVMWRQNITWYLIMWAKKIFLIITDIQWKIILIEIELSPIPDENLNTVQLFWLRRILHHHKSQQKGNHIRPEKYVRQYYISTEHSNSGGPAAHPINSWLILKFFISQANILKTNLDLKLKHLIYTQVL